MSDREEKLFEGLCVYLGKDDRIQEYVILVMLERRGMREMQDVWKIDVVELIMQQEGRYYNNDYVFNSRWYGELCSY